MEVARADAREATVVFSAEVTNLALHELFESLHLEAPWVNAGLVQIPALHVKRWVSSALHAENSDFGWEAE